MIGALFVDMFDTQAPPPSSMRSATYPATAAFAFSLSFRVWVRRACVSSPLAYSLSHCLFPFSLSSSPPSFLLGTEIDLSHWDGYHGSVDVAHPFRHGKRAVYTTLHQRPVLFPVVPWWGIISSLTHSHTLICSRTLTRLLTHTHPTPQNGKSARTFTHT